MRNLWLPTAFTFPQRNEKTDLTGLFLGHWGNWKARRHEINRAGYDGLANTSKQACRTIDDNLAGTLKGDRQSARLLVVAVFATFMQFHSVQRHCSYFSGNTLRSSPAFRDLQTQSSGRPVPSAPRSSALRSRYRTQIGSWPCWRERIQDGAWDSSFLPNCCSASQYRLAE